MKRITSILVLVLLVGLCGCIGDLPKGKSLVVAEWNLDGSINDLLYGYNYNPPKRGQDPLMVKEDKCRYPVDIGRTYYVWVNKDPSDIKSRSRWNDKEYSLWKDGDRVREGKLMKGL